MSFYQTPTFTNMGPPIVTFNPTLTANLPMSQSVAVMPHLEDVTSVTASDYQNNDPVTKAVMDNIMGKLPTKKQIIISTCNICKLEFSGQIVLDMHLAGAKHAKKVKSQEILAQLQTTGETFTSDEKTKILKCDVCNIVVNSSQQLQTHLSGNKHKQKALRMSKVQPIDRKVVTSGKTSKGISADIFHVVSKTTSMIPDSVPCCTNETPNNEENRPGVQLIKESFGAKTKKYFCDTCDVLLNSDQQLEQHLNSRKHKDKFSKPKQPRPTPYWRKPRISYDQEGGRGGGAKKQSIMAQYQNPLSSNFVSGGSIMM